MIAFELDEQIDAYEAALVAGEATIDDVNRFLPPQGEARRGEMLVELLRISLEHAFQRGQKEGLNALLARFPEVAADANLLAPLAYEEYRLRVGDGQDVDRQEYAHHYGIDVTAWQDLTPEATQRHAAVGTDSAASWQEFSLSAPHAAAVLAAGRRTLPAVGERFGPFRLAALLGQGAFGKVFLARQETLSDRYVALKITAGPPVEADRLARMQHTNIVPVYSVHRRGRLSGVCMPYLGGVTLADVLARLRSSVSPKSSSHIVAETVAARQAELSTLLEENRASAEDGIDQRLPPRAGDAMARLAARPQEEALCWIAWRVAAGLAHAHERGIVHRDLKPANILISDDGEPLVLDFNLATDNSPAAAHLARLGGTLPYMSPEQLQSFAEGAAAESNAIALGPASDVYALGVVLYESLTRELPFPIHDGNLEEVVRAMLNDRQQPAAPVRTLNPAVSPGLTAIVAKCLTADPAERYRNAGELCEDLRRHLENLPLVYARDRSPRERIQKWCRRHPRLSSASSITAAAAVLALVAGSFWMARETRFAQRQAEDKFQQFHAAVPQARTLLIVSVPQSAEEKQGIAEAENLLKGYGAGDDPTWELQPAIRRLSEASHRQLSENVADLQSLLAARRSPEAADGAAPPPGEKVQQPSTARLVAAVANVRRGQTNAIAPLEELVTSRPNDAASWLVLADCRRLADDPAGAEAACTAAIALRSDLYLPWYYRGLVRLSQKRAADAAADFGQAIARRAEFSGGWANRGLAREQLGKHAEAIDDLSRAIDRGVQEQPIYFARARCYEALGERETAESDWQAGLAALPGDPRTWFERGMVHVRRQEWEPAEHDFRQASVLLPTYLDALRNLAHVQSERLGKTEAGIDTQTRVLEVQPNDIAAHAGRGVLYARLGKASEALADASRVIRQSPPPLAVYQVACIYALLAGDDSAKRNVALAWLQRALMLDASLAETARDDADLENLRGEESFRKWTGAADGKNATASANLPANEQQP